MRFLLAAALALAAFPALAQDARPEAPKDPCVAGDTVNCQLGLDAVRMGGLMSEVNRLQATNQALQAELQKVRRELVDARVPKPAEPAPVGK